MRHALLTRRRLAYLVCVLGMALCVSGPLQTRAADQRHQAAVRAGQETQAQVIDVGSAAARLPLQPSTSYHLVAFEHEGRTRTEQLAGVPAPGTTAVQVLVGPQGVSSALALHAERVAALPSTVVFIACLLALLHMLTVDAVRRRAARRAHRDATVLDLMPERSVGRAA
jgi:hypothetical protein